MRSNILTGFMLPEFTSLKEAASIAWPTDRPTYLLRPEYADVIYSNDALPYGLSLRVSQSCIIPRIILRVYRKDKYKADFPDVIDIWIEPGYKIFKQGRVIWKGVSTDEMVSFVVDGIMRRVEKTGLLLQRDS